MMPPDEMPAEAEDGHAAEDAAEEETDREAVEEAEREEPHRPYKPFLATPTA
jgi:hypothetical protein